MNYPFRFPFPVFFAKLGFNLTIKIEIYRDTEADVYIAVSDDVPGLVIEAESYTKLKAEVAEAIPNLLELKNNSNYQHTSADLIYKDHIALA